MMQAKRSNNLNIYSRIVNETADSHDLLNQNVIQKRHKAIKGISSAKEHFDNFKIALGEVNKVIYEPLIEILEENIREAEEDIEKACIYTPTKSLRDFSNVIRLFERCCRLFHSKLCLKKYIEASQYFLTMLDCLDADNVRDLPKNYKCVVESMGIDIELATEAMEERGINHSYFWSTELSGLEEQIESQ